MFAGILRGGPYHSMQDTRTVAARPARVTVIIGSDEIGEDACAAQR